VVPAAPRATTSPRVGPTRAARPGAARADALADAVSTPSFRTGRGRPRRRGRRVTRIVRRIELWSVLKIALVFNTILLGVVLGSVALLWGLANTTGLVDDLEGFLRDAGFEDFRFKGDRMFEQVAFIGAVGALATTVFMVLATALLNLISEITGGIRFVVIEEIVETPAAPARPPTPLALPTIPPTGPPLVAPAPATAPPPSPGAGDWETAGRSGQPATGAPSPTISTAKTPPATTSTTAKTATAKTATARTRTSKPVAAKKPAGAKKATARRTATARSKPQSQGTTSSSGSSDEAGGETSTSSGRRVRRQGAAPLRPASRADDATEDDTST